MENARDIKNKFGSDALKQTYSQPRVQDIMPSVYSQALKIQEHNPKVGPVGDVVKSIAIPLGSKGGIWGGAAAGATAASVEGLKHSSATWNKEIQGIMPSKPTGLPTPGGVSVNFAEVTWDSGDWPFVPLYALTYPSGSGTVARLAQEGGVQ